MREIKFRAWDKDYKYMSYKVMVGNVWDEDNYHAHMIWVDSEKVDYECVSGWMNFDEHSNIEIMQYTGLKDKNDTEIYEGDVLYVEQIDRIDPYIPHNTNVAVRYEGRDTAFVFDEEVGFVIGLYSMPRELEVIGNIYENPELLERK